jgi:hypothetical protein
MLIVRASVGFTFFHLFFWFKVWTRARVVRLSLSLASVLTMLGNAIAPWIRHRAKEETMLVGALA